MARTKTSDGKSRPPIPAAVQLVVLTQAGHCCSVCGAEAALEFAHIKPWATTRSHDPNNLVCLCSNCHARADREKWGYKALLWYRANPHILRRSAGAPSEIQNRTSAQIVIDMPFDRFGARERGLTQLALAKLLDIDLEAVELLDVEESSVKITFSVPPDMPSRFDDPRLQDVVRTFLPWLLDRDNSIVASLEAAQLERSDTWTPDQPEFWAKAVRGPFDDWPKEIRDVIAPYWSEVETTGIPTASERTLRLLPFLAFFRNWGDPDHLGIACRGDEVPKRLRDADGAVWMEALLELQSTGLVRRVSDHPRSPFELRSLLPWYLAQAAADEPDAEALEATFRRFAAELASSIVKALQGGGTAAQAVQLFQQNESTLRHALGLALRRRQLEESHALYNCLHTLMTHRGQIREAAQMIEVLSDALRPEGRLEAGSLDEHVWLDLLFKRANYAQSAGRLDAAEAIYLEVLETRGESSTAAAAIFGQLGTAALKRRDLEAAELWYRRSLDLSSQQGNSSNVAIGQHQLGMVAEERGDWDDAERWYQKSLELHLSQGDEVQMASNYHQLGVVAQKRRDLEHAKDWYRKSLELNLKIDRPAKAAATFHQLGRLAQEHRDFEAAERWYQKSLEVHLRLDDGVRAASNYYQLGVLAQERRDLDAAERWYLKSLEIERSTGDMRGAALSEAQLGTLALERERGEEGVDLLIRARRQLEELDRDDATRAVHVIRNSALRKGLIDRPGVEMLWHKHFDAPIPGDIAEILFAERDELAADRPAMPDPMRETLSRLLRTGLSFDQVVQVIEQGTGQSLASEMVDWLRSELMTAGTNSSDDEVS